MFVVCGNFWAHIESPFPSTRRRVGSVADAAWVKANKGSFEVWVCVRLGVR